MEACMDAALKAPNSSNLQTWGNPPCGRCGEEGGLGRGPVLSQPAAGTAPELLVFVGQAGFVEDATTNGCSRRLDRAGTVPESAFQYYRKITPLVYDQGAFGWRTPFKWWITRWRGLRKPIPREPIGKWGMRIWAHKSTALACAQFMLAMRAHGF